MIEPKITFLHAELKRFARVLYETTRDKDGLQLLLRPLGYAPLLDAIDSAYSFTLPELQALDDMLLSRLPASLDQAFGYDFAAFLTDLTAIRSALFVSLRNALDVAVANAAPELSASERNNLSQTIFDDTVQHLFCTYLQREYGLLFKLALFINLVAVDTAPPLSAGGRAFRHARQLRYRFQREAAAQYAQHSLHMLDSLFADTDSRQEFLDSFLRTVWQKATGLAEELREATTISVDLDGVALTTAALQLPEEAMTLTSTELAALQLDFFDRIEFLPPVEGDGAPTVKLFWKQDPAAGSIASAELTHRVGAWTLALPARDPDDGQPARLAISRVGSQISIQLQGYCRVIGPDRDVVGGERQILSAWARLDIALDTTPLADTVPPHLPTPTLVIALDDLVFDGANLIHSFGGSEKFAVEFASVAQIRVESKLNPQTSSRYEVQVALSSFSFLLPKEVVHKARLDGQRVIGIAEDAARLTFTMASAHGNLLQLTVDSEGELFVGALVSDANPAAPVVTSDPLFVGDPIQLDSGLLVVVEQVTFDVASGKKPLLHGFGIDNATIYLPQTLPRVAPAELTVRNFRLDERGVSTSIAGTWDIDPATLNADHPNDGFFGLLPGYLSFVSITVKDNIPTGAQISGYVLVPYFDQFAAVTVAIDAGWKLLIGLAAVGGELVELRREELLILALRSLTLRKEETSIAVVVSGQLQPLLFASDGLEWPRLDVTDLYIDSTGKLQIKEAWIDLQELATLDLWGFHFELSRIGVGYQESDDKLWLDLSGGVRLIEQIPVALGVEGFRLTWPTALAIEGPPSLGQAIQIASAVEVKFDGIYLFFGVPNAVEFEGLIRFFKNAQAAGFAGDMALRIPATGLSVEAGLLIGMNFEPPPYPFLYLSFGFDLPAGIPLAQSGLALKGAQGLFGLNVAPNKTPEQNWYYDWYKRGPIVGAHPTNKWRNERNALAIGMGLTVTTADGFVKGTRGLLVLAVPGPILIIEGRALIFDGLTPAEPPLRALAVIDGREEIIQFNIEAEAELIEDMLEAYGMLEAFFDFKDLTNWHLYLGQDEPSDRRIQAEVLKLGSSFLFKADAYLMVDMVGAQTMRSRMGVFVGFKPAIPDIGPLKITLDVELEGEGEVTVLPEQFSGAVGMAGTFEVEAFGFGVRVAARGDVAAEGPKPLKVGAELAISVEPPFIDPVEVTFEMQWQLQEKPDIEPPLLSASAWSKFSPGGGALSIVEKSSVADASKWRDAADSSPIVAMDVRPILSFGHEVNDYAGKPGAEEPEPAFGRHADGVLKTYDVGLMRFTPSVTTVRLYEHRKGKPWPATLEDWTPIASSRRAEVAGAVKALPGVWMAEADPSAASYPSTRQLQLWTNNPLLHAANSLGRGYGLPFQTTATSSSTERRSNAEQLLELYPDLMECGDIEPQRVCSSFAKMTGTKLQPAVLWTHEKLKWTVHSYAASVEQRTGRGGCLVGRGRMSIRFPEPVKEAQIHFCDAPAAYAASTVEAARSAITVQELEQITLEAEAKNAKPDFAVCRFPVVRTVAEKGDIWTVTSNEGFTCLTLFKDHAFSIAEVCYTTVAEYNRALRAQAQCETNAAQHEESTNVLQAGSFYRLDVETTVVGTVHGGDNGLQQLYSAVLEMLGLANQVKTYSDVAFFQTENRPTAIAPYVKWVNPAPQQTRVFRNDDFAIRFLRPYLVDVFRPPNNLELLVQSVKGDLIEGYRNAWEKSQSASLLHEEQLWRDHRESIDLPNAAVKPDDVLWARRQTGGLEADSRYNLLLTGGAGGALLLEDDFEELSNEVWKTDLRGWRAVHNNLHRPGTGSPYVLAGNASWTDVQVAVEIKLKRDTVGGVVVRASSPARRGKSVWNACLIALSRNADGSGSLRLRALQRVAGARESLPLLHQRNVDLPEDLWLRLRVSVLGNRLRVWIFDDLVIEGSLYQVKPKWTAESRAPGSFVWFSDLPSGSNEEAISRGDLVPSTSGQTGLYAEAKGPLFRRLRVRDAVLHRSSFTTSKFGSFRELLESGTATDRITVNASGPSSALSQSVHDTSAELATASWNWHRAHIDHRFEEVDRQGLEEQRLALREARAAHDAAFRTLADTINSELSYAPFASHVECFLLRNDSGVFGLWLRSPETLDLRQYLRDDSGVLTGDLVGRTTINLAPGPWSNFDLFRDADSTQILIFRKDRGVWASGPGAISFDYSRDHGDETSSRDHRYDRVIESAATSDTVAVLPLIIK